MTMETINLDDAIFLGMLLNETLPSAEHPLKKPDCPAIPEFEKLATSSPLENLKWRLHKNNCPYCQLTCRLFREEMNIPTWWERLHTTFDLPQPNLVQAAGEKELALVMPSEANAEPKPVAIEVLAARFTGDQCGRLRIKLEAPLPGVKPETPIELALITYPGGQPLEEFLLPSLNSRGEERLKVWLPASERAIWRKLNEPTNETKRTLPFRFVLRPGSEPLTPHRTVACAGIEFRSVPRRRTFKERMLPPRLKEVAYGIISVVSQILVLGQ